MLKKTITYTNIDNVEVTEDAYFHLSKADVIEMQFTQKDGLQAWLARIGQSTDPKEIIDAFKTLVEKSYRVRTPEGKGVRIAQKTEEFMSSEAYSEFFMEIITDATKAAEFMNGIIPSGLDDATAKIQKQVDLMAAADTSDIEVPALEKVDTALEPSSAPDFTESTTPRVLSAQEVIEMDADELKSGLATGRYRLS